MRKTIICLIICLFCVVNLCACENLGEDEYTENLSYEIENEEVTITGVIDDKLQYEKIKIPSEIEGMTVTKIANCAFEGFENVTDIEIPNTVISIGVKAFSGCTKLNKVNIPSGVKMLRAATFEDCSSLTYIDLPINLELIGNMAFKGCSNLNNVVINEKVKGIGHRVFEDCKSLTKVYLFNPFGWSVKSGESEEIVLTNSELSNDSTVATYFTSTYLNYQWNKNTH